MSRIVITLTSVLLGVAGQLCFKAVVRDRAGIGIIEAAVVSFRSYLFWLGVAAYSASLILWMKVLADSDLSWARPFAGIGYVITALLAWYFFNEHISASRWLGIGFICAGVFLIART